MKVNGKTLRNIGLMQACLGGAKLTLFIAGIAMFASS
jgi:hypothetical protein